MLSKIKIVSLAASAATLALLAVSAGQASASVAAPRPVTPSVSAWTHMTDRSDSGGSGNWATDSFWRLAVVDELGTVAGSNCLLPATSTIPCYGYSATLHDNGTARTDPGALTPNQGGLRAGTRLPARPLVTSLAGTGGFPEFYSTATPTARPPLGTMGDALSSGTWPQLFFPAGSVLNGLSETTFDYRYDATVTHFRTVVRTGHKIVFVFRHHHWVPEVVTYRYPVLVPVLVHESWTDADFNDGGQAASAGNITG